MRALESTPLILFSGLAADANIFVPQKLAFPQLVVPAWPVPLAGESMSAYCGRLADQLRAYGPCVIGGASFGGVIAQEVAQQVRPLAVVLIGSIRCPSELPLYVRCCRPLRFLVPLIPVRLVQLLIRPLASKAARRFLPQLSGLASQFRSCDCRVFKWSLRRILDWQTRPQPVCPVFHIHGQRDYVLPSSRTQPDQIVIGGGHLISLTHPTEVNEFIRHVLADVGSH